MRNRDLLICAALLMLGAWFTLVWAAAPNGMGAFDIYSYYVPNMLYAQQRLHAGGTGLWWNPYQNSGQPFFGISSSGPLYPLNLFFLVLPSDRALLAVTVGNLAIAGIGMYFLMRELGVGRAAALCGALAFELGTATIDLTTWGPQMAGTFVWMPAALLFCERLLRAPTLGNAVGLGVVLMLALLPGFPQCVFFTYQVIALRVLYEFATRRVERPWKTLGTAGLGLALAPLLDAVQLLPGTEMAAQSIRGGNLRARELQLHAAYTWTVFRRLLMMRAELFNPLLLLPAVVAGASWFQAPTRRRAIFYTLTGVLYFLLALGNATPLFAIYTRLPLGSLFRDPARFTWVTSFCLAVLTGLGADALINLPRQAAWPRRWGPVACMAAMLGGLYFLVPNRLYPIEWILAGAIMAGAVCAGFGRTQAATLLVVGATIVYLSAFVSPLLPGALQSIGVRYLSPRRLLADDTILVNRAPLFGRLRDAMTAEDRIYIVHRHPNFNLMPKSASLFQVPSIQDYEPQPTRRSAEYNTMMRTGRRLTSLNDYYYPGARQFAPGFRKRLLDLAGARYVVVDIAVDNSRQMVTPALYPFAVSPDLNIVVYENQQALPRARFVPTVDVVPNSDVLLHRLAYGTDDFRQIALLEDPPPSGFRGQATPPEEGTADIVVDDPERVVVRVQAPRRGFLHLADQYFSGWRATVNGAPAPIMRADYLFRAVEVPAGESTVEFRYAPASVRIGAAITVATVLALIVVALRRP